MPASMGVLGQSASLCPHAQKDVHHRITAARNAQGSHVHFTCGGAWLQVELPDG